MQSHLGMETTLADYNAKLKNTKQANKKKQRD